MPLPDATPYWRLSGFYLAYFASLGALIPFWGLYLQDLGHDAAAIGELMALLLATKIIAPNLWAWLADRRGERIRIVRVASLAALVCFGGVFVSGGYLWLALVMVAFSFFWNASLPQFEALTLSHLARDPHRYGLVRVWGSVGFIISVLALGALFEVTGRGWLPWIVLGLFGLVWGVSLSVPDAGRPTEEVRREPLLGVLRRPEVAALLGACLLMQASHGPYYAFFSIHLDQAGYGQQMIGALWALGVIAEIGIFLVAAPLLRRFTPRTLLLASLLLTALRWLLVGGLVEHLGWLLVAQLLHAASFGIYHAAAIQLVHRFFPRGARQPAWRLRLGDARRDGDVLHRIRAGAGRHAGRLALVARLRCCLVRCAGVGQRQRDPEQCATAGPALGTDPPVHRLDEPAAQGESEAGASEAACRVVLGLGELDEQLVGGALRQADAGVEDVEVQRAVAALAGLVVGLDAYVTLVGELDGVVDQVFEHRADVSRVADQSVRHHRVAAEFEVQALLLRRRAHR
jgi:PPP family 3-phenylpropionic acid transporter